MSGPQCCENPPTLSPSSGVGAVIEFGGLQSYVSGSSDSKLVVILASDVFGYEAPDLRKIADKIAAAGFYVVVPDFFHGDPFDLANAEKPLLVWKSLHEPVKAFEDVKPVIEALKSKGILAIGAAGFCYGAKVVVELAKSRLIEAGVLLHPSFVTLDDIKEVKAPLAILGAETDQFSPPELVKQYEEILLSNSEVASFVKIFPGVAHGWTVRYRRDDEMAVKSAEEAHQDTLNWFIKFVNSSIRTLGLPPMLNSLQTADGPLPRSFKHFSQNADLLCGLIEETGTCCNTSNVGTDGCTICICKAFS